MRHPRTKNVGNDLIGMPRPGEILDSKYRIDDVLGVGGMAAVFGATHLRLNEKVAIKLMLPEWAEDESLVERFVNEGRSAAQIRSEHVVRVLDADQFDGKPYLVLEYLDGVDLDALVATEGPLPIPRAIDFVLQTCEALAEAHAAGIVHRDLKPANLFLCHRADGSPCVKVLDFGISKVTRGSRDSGLRSLGTLPNTVMGSPHYMSPEQMVSSRNVDARSDIWSLGAILHELLSGAPPFEADTMTALCARILREAPPPLTRVRADVPSALEQIVLRCLEKEPARRFDHVGELARALVPFGSAEALLSASRVARIVDGGAGSRSSSMPVVFAPAEEPRVIRAAEVLDSIPPTPLRRPLGAYAIFALLLVALGGAATWQWARPRMSVLPALAQPSRVVEEPPAIPPPPAQSAPPPAPPAPVTEPAPSPSASSALAASSASIPLPSAPASAAAPNHRAAPSRRPHVRHSEAPPWHAPDIVPTVPSALPDDDNPYSAPSDSSPATSDGPHPPDSTSPFGGRK